MIKLPLCSPWLFSQLNGWNRILIWVHCSLDCVGCFASLWYWKYHFATQWQILGFIRFIQTPSCLPSLYKTAIFNAKLTKYCFGFFQYNLQKITSFSGTLSPRPLTEALSLDYVPPPDSLTNPVTTWSRLCSRRCSDVRNLQGDRNTIHKNLVASLFIAEVVFLVGIMQFHRPVSHS